MRASLAIVPITGLLFGVGCAHGGPAEQAETRPLPPPPVQVARKQLVGTPKHERPPVVAEAPLPVEPLPVRDVSSAPPRGVDVEPDLIRLERVLSSLRAAVTSGTRRNPAPGVVVKEWDRVIDRLDTYLDQPPRETPPVALVRAKVSLETELDATARVWVIPGGTLERVRGRLAYIEHRLRQARATMEPVPAAIAATLHWPLDPVVVNSDFGWRNHPVQRRRLFHYGVDLDGYRGQAVTAAAPGRVTWSGPNGGHGEHVEIIHPGGWVTRYSHLSMRMVSRGDEVEVGQPIGLVGETGRATGPHLHFEVWRGGDAHDPREVVGEPVYSEVGDVSSIGG